MKKIFQRQRAPKTPAVPAAPPVPDPSQQQQQQQRVDENWVLLQQSPPHNQQQHQLPHHQHQPPPPPPPHDHHALPPLPPLQVQTPGTPGEHHAAFERAASVSAHSDTPPQLPPPAPGKEPPAAKLHKKGGGLFSRGGDRDKDKHEPRRDHGAAHRDGPTGQPGELTRMIGYLTGFASDDWTIVLEVCERAAANDTNAKEAAKALRREFKYAEPSAQMAAARLWAIMLRYSSDIFIAQTTTKKFLDVVEDVCTSTKTTPVVRERLLEVLAGAAYAHPSAGRDGFAGAWRRVKLAGQPDEGIPFDDLDPMFTPPPPKRRAPQYGTGEHGAVPVSYVERNPLDPQRQRRERRERPQQIPSAEEDMRRLFDECEVARANANLLTQAMTFTKPTDMLNNTVIMEFHSKCMASQNFIVEQIPWATANAERSRERLDEQQALQAVAAVNINGTIAQQNITQAHAETVEEQLLASLLLANQELVEAFRQYDEMESIGLQEAEEREVEARSRVETKLDRTQIQYWSADGTLQLEAPGQSGGPSRSPSPASFNHPSRSLPPLTHHPSLSSNGTSQTTPQIHAQPPTPTGLHHTMPPPPPAPIGPRNQRSRTPSPPRANSTHSHGQAPSRVSEDASSEPREYREPRELDRPLAPSAKALGKRRAVEHEFDTHDLFRTPAATPGVQALESSNSDESDGESSRMNKPKWAKPPVFVYDAAAERSKEWQAAQLAQHRQAQTPAQGHPFHEQQGSRPYSHPNVAPVQTQPQTSDVKGKGKQSPAVAALAEKDKIRTRSASQTTLGKTLPRSTASLILNGTARP